MTYQNTEDQYSKDEKPSQKVEPAQEQQQPYTGNQEQPNYGQPSGYNAFSSQQVPENYMVLSIVATVIGCVTCCTSCCVSAILGIIAIVFSSQVSTKYISGDYEGALNSGKTAKTLAIVSLALTGVAFLGTMIYYAIVFSTAGFETFMDQYMEALEEVR